MSYEQLKLENQLCFPVYAASRLLVREYQPHLDALGITYPQYLVLMVLWEADQVSVSAIAERLLLNTNTLTPLLKRLEAQGIVERRRSEDDERRVIVGLTAKGRGLEAAAAPIPELFIAGLASHAVGLDELTSLRDKLNILIDHLAAASG